MHGLLRWHLERESLFTNKRTHTDNRTQYNPFEQRIPEIGVLDAMHSFFCLTHFDLATTLTTVKSAVRNAPKRLLAKNVGLNRICWVIFYFERISKFGCTYALEFH